MKENEIVDSYYIEFNQKVYDIQRIFVSLCVTDVSGIETLGKAKNIISETYAESSSMRVYVPPTVTFDTSTVTIEVAFLGDNAEEEQIMFNNFLVSNPLFVYFDTYRRRKATLLFNGGAVMSSDYRQLHGYEQNNALVFKYTLDCEHIDDNILSENDLLNYDIKAIKNISEYVQG